MVVPQNRRILGRQRRRGHGSNYPAAGVHDVLLQNNFVSHNVACEFEFLEICKVVEGFSWSEMKSHINFFSK